MWRLLQILGAICLAIVLFADAAGAFHLFPSVGWGKPDSIGYYLDIVFGIFGSILIVVGLAGNGGARR